MGKSLNYEFIKGEFIKNGLELLDSKYLDNNTPMLCKDEDGYLGYVKYSNLQSGKKFKPFSKRNPMGMYNLKLFLQKNNIKSEIMFNEMPDSKKSVAFRCECGVIFHRDVNHIVNRGFCRCPQCALESRSMKRKIPKISVKNFLLKCGYEMIQDFYENNSSFIEVEDSDGYKGFVTYNGLKGKKRMSRFNMSVNEKYFIYNINIFCKNNSIKSEAIRIINKKNTHNTLIEFACECGETFYSTQPSFVYGGKNRCDVCSGKMSSYERMVAEYLDNSDINYIYQKRYRNCKNKTMLPFDFYLNDYNVLIEVDGEGHFFPVRYNGISEDIAQKNFIKTKNNDAIKDIYCKRIGIRLIRIPYFDFKNEKYIETIKNSLLK